MKRLLLTINVITLDLSVCEFVCFSNQGCGTDSRSSILTMDDPSWH